MVHDFDASSVQRMMTAWKCLPWKGFINLPVGYRGYCRLRPLQPTRKRFCWHVLAANLAIAGSGLLSDEKRDELSRQWQTWKTAAKGGREINQYGHLQDYPLDHLDKKLLNRLSPTEPQSTAKVIGQLMVEHAGMVPDGFLFCRLELMRKKGTVIYLADDKREKSPPEVMLA